MTQRAVERLFRQQQAETCQRGMAAVVDIVQNGPQPTGLSADAQQAADLRAALTVTALEVGQIGTRIPDGAPVYVDPATGGATLAKPGVPELLNLDPAVKEPLPSNPDGSTPTSPPSEAALADVFPDEGLQFTPAHLEKWESVPYVTLLAEQNEKYHQLHDADVREKTALQQHITKLRNAQATTSLFLFLGLLCTTSFNASWSAWLLAALLLLGALVTARSVKW